MSDKNERGQFENTWKLLQPELLSSQELLDILKEKNVSVGKESERDQLIELFKRIAMPQSQRSRFSSNLPAPGTCNNKRLAKETKPVESLRTSFSEIKLKRNASQALGTSCGDSADDSRPQQKREKITWP